MSNASGTVVVDLNDTANLNITISRLLAPMILNFRNDLHGGPEDLTDNEWEQILDKIVRSFERIGTGQATMNHPIDRSIGGISGPPTGYDPETREGLLLFAEYFIDLWD